MARFCCPLLLAALLLGCSESASDRRDVPVSVEFVAFDERVGSPVVVLGESDGKRRLPIWIGVAEARSIAAEIEHQQPPRPNTHDLARRLIEGLNGRVERVVVTELRSGVYYASLVLSLGGREIEIDARPSDAIAIGLRMQAPLFAREPLLEKEATGDDAESAQSVELRLPTRDAPATRAVETANFDGKT